MSDPDDLDSEIAEFGDGEADACPTCGLASCIGRFQMADCDHLDSLPFGVPLTPANPAAPKPKCRRHDWAYPRCVQHPDGGCTVDEREMSCVHCGRTYNAAASKRGNRNRQRGNSIERELGKKLGMARTGQYGGKDDLANEMFAAQVKSGGYFSNRQWDWLKAVPVKAGQTALLVIADTPGPGKKRRAMVILDAEDWRALHGTVAE